MPVIRDKILNIARTGFGKPAVGQEPGTVGNFADRLLNQAREVVGGEVEGVRYTAEVPTSAGITAKPEEEPYHKFYKLLDDHRLLTTESKKKSELERGFHEFLKHKLDDPNFVTVHVVHQLPGEGIEVKSETRDVRVPEKNLPFAHYSNLLTQLNERKVFGADAVKEAHRVLDELGKRCFDTVSRAVRREYESREVYGSFTGPQLNRIIEHLVNERVKQLSSNEKTPYGRISKAIGEAKARVERLYKPKDDIEARLPVIAPPSQINGYYVGTHPSRNPRSKWHTYGRESDQVWDPANPIQGKFGARAGYILSHLAEMPGALELVDSFSAETPPVGFCENDEASIKKSSRDEDPVAEPCQHFKKLVVLNPEDTAKIIRCGACGEPLSQESGSKVHVLVFRTVPYAGRFAHPEPDPNADPRKESKQREFLKNIQREKDIESIEKEIKSGKLKIKDHATLRCTNVTCDLNKEPLTVDEGSLSRDPELQERVRGLVVTTTDDKGKKTLWCKKCNNVAALVRIPAFVGRENKLNLKHPQIAQILGELRAHHIPKSEVYKTPSNYIAVVYELTRAGDLSVLTHKGSMNGVCRYLLHLFIPKDPAYVTHQENADLSDDEAFKKLVNELRAHGQYDKVKLAPGVETALRGLLGHKVKEKDILDIGRYIKGLDSETGSEERETEQTLTRPKLGGKGNKPKGRKPR